MGTLGLVDKKTRTKTLIIDSLDNANLVLSSRNVQKTKVTNSFGLNIYDIIYHEKLLISKAALEELSALLDPKRETGTTGTAADVLAEKPKAKKEAAAPAEAVIEETPKAKREAKPKAEKEAKPKVEKAPKKETAAKEETPAVETAEEAPAVKPTEEATENE